MLMRSTDEDLIFFFLSFDILTTKKGIVEIYPQVFLSRPQKLITALPKG